MSNCVEQHNWKFYWRLTESAGVAIYLAEYKGRRVLWEATLPYVTVDHQRSSEEVIDEEGARDHGPWWAPLGTRTLVGGVRVQTFHGGVEVSASFAVGPYNYQQLWRFHDDGRICPWLTIFGSGVHDQHTYHPHWRLDFDLERREHDAFEHFEDGRWQRVAEEGWFPYTGEADEHGNVWRQVDFGSTTTVNIRPHVWDDAEMFAIRHHDGEWAPFAPRAGGAGSQPYPAAYVGSEPIDGEDVILWYVAHVHFDQSFPYTAGPWIKVEA